MSSMTIDPTTVVASRERAPLAGRILLRSKLRQAKRNADTQTVAAISKALDNEEFIAGTVEDLMDEAKVSSSSTGVTLPTDWLAKLAKFLIDNLPSILALILVLFG